MTEDLRSLGLAEPPAGAASSRAGADQGPCEQCPVRRLCLPGTLDGDERRLVATAVREQRSLGPSRELYRSGSPYRRLYAVRTGSLKSVVVSPDGREQVTGFHLPGDIVGMDGIGWRTHTVTVKTLEAVRVCEVSFDELERLARDHPAIQRTLHRLFGAEIARERSQLLVLGTMDSRERLATFLLGVSRSMESRGYSPRAFNLTMSRRDIGNYLGLTLETVSRAFSHLQALGAIRVENRHVRVQDPRALEAVLLQ